MQARTAPSTTTPHDSSGSRITHRLASTALIVLVLGVLPIAWDASAVWQVLGSVVSVALVVHTAQALWREVFSTDPRHLARG